MPRCPRENFSNFRHIKAHLAGKYFDLVSGSFHLDKLIAATLMIVGLALACFAQPGGEPQRFRRLAENLQHEITIVTGEIATWQNDVQLREKRADLYTRLYTTTCDNPYVHLSDVAPGVKPLDLITSAIGDYSRIISSHSGKPEHFLKRGEAYAVRWSLTKVDWDTAMRTHDPFWGDRTDWGDKALVDKVFKQFITNPDFDLAMADFQRAAKDHTTEIEAEQKIGMLLDARIGWIPLWYSDRDAVRHAAEAGIAGFSIWRDYDSVIELFSKTARDGPDDNSSSRSMFWRHYAERPSPQGAILGKLKTAVLYSRDKDVAAIFDHDLLWMNFDYQNADRACQYYSVGLRAHVRLGNYDRVLATVGNVLYDGAPTKCEAVIEPRGDAYLGKGKFALAVANYNAALDHKEWQSSDPEIRIKRAKAYIGLGDKEKALADLNWVIPKGYSSYGLIQAHLLRASLLREKGMDKEASEDEKLVDYMRQSQLQSAERDREYKKRKGVLYGKVLKPNGQPLDDTEGYAIVKYSDGSTDSWWPEDEEGRFLLRLKALPFTLSVVRIEKGEEVNYVAHPDKFPAITKPRGPIVINLSRGLPV